MKIGKYYGNYETSKEYGKVQEHEKFLLTKLFLSISNTRNKKLIGIILEITTGEDLI